MTRQLLFCTVLAGALTLQGGLTPASQAQQDKKAASAIPALPFAINSGLNSVPSAPVSSNLSPVTAIAPMPSGEPKIGSSLSATASTAPSPPSSQKSQPSVAPLFFSAPIQKRPTMRLKVMVSGKARSGEVVVKPKMTVGQALAAMGISLAVLDRVVPDASALARDGMAVRVNRVSNAIEKRRVAVAAELRYQPTTAIKAGTKKQIQSPREGALEISERVWRVDGKITKREFVSQRLARVPQNRVVALGVMSHLMPDAIRPHRRYARALPGSRGGSWGDRLKFKTPDLPPANPNHFKAVKAIKVLATGYSAGPAGGAIGNWTATGVRCTYGAVAVDPRLIPLGSKLYIEGYGYGFACDIGGAIKGRHVDLAFNSPRAAFANGKRRTTVWILAPDA